MTAKPKTDYLCLEEAMDHGDEEEYPSHEKIRKMKARIKSASKAKRKQKLKRGRRLTEGTK